MTQLREHVQRFCELLERGDALGAMDRYYGDDVCVFENRELARAGRTQCLNHEKELLAKVQQPPTFKLHRTAVNEATGAAFLEYTLRFVAADGRPMRIEEVAVQTWERDRIVTERFYYEGLVDEGDELDASP